MTSLRVIIVVCFGMAFGAGLVAGKLWERTASAAAQTAQPPSVVTPKPEDKSEVAEKHDVQQGGWLAPLKLTSEQNEQMKAIWSGVMKNGPQRHKQSEALKKERDDAVKALMTEEQRGKYVSLNTKFEHSNADAWAKMQETQARCRKERDEGVKAIFTDDQKRYYDDIYKNYQTKTDEVAREWKKMYEDALTKTKALLSPEQWTKYEEIRNGRQPHHDGQRMDGPRGDRPGPRGNWPGGDAKGTDKAGSTSGGK
ncbi:MAG TPA: hypothetical protein VKX17_00450 [Planctomycetota bacterium]|nr:hypothetical protein [Planctomycetota bacterium]